MKLHRRCRTALATLGVGCALIAPTAASAETTEVLAPELEQLATPAVQEQPIPEQAEAVGLPAGGPGSLEREGSEVTVEISFEEGALAALPALREAGAEIVVSSDAYQLVTARVDPADLDALAAVPGVTGVNAVRKPLVSAVGSEPSVDEKAICEGGTTLTEGLEQLGVVTQPNSVGAREAFGVRGAGQTVGVLSDTFDAATSIENYDVEQHEQVEIPIPGHAAEDIQSDNLPGLENNCTGQQTPVDVLEEGPSGSYEPAHDEGRAMLQIVHDIAPHASLAFATADGGELNFAHNIERLAAPVAAGGAGANVIVDDVSYFEEPMFQDGPIAAAIAKVTAAGVTYLTSGGNNNISANRQANGPEIGSWETPAFTDTENPAYCPIPVGVAARHCLDFDPGSGEDDKFAVTIEVHKSIRLVVGWSEPWYGVKADLDAYLLRYVDPKKALKEGETEVVDYDNRGNVKGGKPAAFVEWQNPEPPKTEGETEEVFLVINRCFGNVCSQEADPAARPRLKVLFFQNGRPIVKSEYESSSGGNVVGPTVYGHHGAAAAITLGASSFSADGIHINTGGSPEAYSSHGPVTHYWGPVLSTAPAAALGSPEVLEKPNVIATDCGATTFFTQFYLGFWRFCGTSAAAPHAAAIVALMRQASPTQSPAGLRAALTATAKPVPGYGANIVGKGLIQARQAIEALSPRVTVSDAPSGLIAPVTPVTPVTPPAGEPGEGSPSPGPSSSSPAPEQAAPGTAGDRESSAKSHGSPKNAPVTRIKSHPPKLVKSKVGRPMLAFAFAADQKGAKFQCSVDKAAWKRCAAKYKAPFLLGRHELRVRAMGVDGTPDDSPAKFSFKVELVA